MELRNLFTDDRAVSPVIGVILMVAITVILAAVIGTFVLGLGDSVQQTTPNANFAGDQSTVTLNNSDEGTFKTLTVTHEGGDRIAESNLDVTVGGVEAYGYIDEQDGNFTALWDGEGDITAGSSIEVVAYNETTVDDTPYNVTGDGAFGNANALSSGDNARVIWSSDDGSSSATLFNRQVN